MLGEFPWRVKVGEEVLADDFVYPPFVLSSETTERRSHVVQGRVHTRRGSLESVRAAGQRAAARKAFISNQPSPYAGKVGGTWGIFALMLLALLVIAIAVRRAQPRRYRVR